MGGEADCLIEIADPAWLPPLVSYLNKVEIPYFVLGNGSNLLVGDKGYRGIVLHLAGRLAQIRVEGNRVIAQAGAYLSQAARTAAQHGLTGLEFAAGIPGTVGGGVVMNAGAYDGEMKQVVEEVSVLDREGTPLTLNNETMEFGYRTSVIKQHPFIVTECSFLLKAGDPEEIRKKWKIFRREEKRSSRLNIPAPAAPSNGRRGISRGS